MSRYARPGLTKTQQLREAKTTAMVRELQKKEEAVRPQQDAFKSRRKPAYEPKKVDFHKPGMTKAMIARMQQAEKMKQEYERKRQEATAGDRVPKRTARPIGGDARLGKEKAPRPVQRPPPVAAGPSTGAIPRPKSRLPQIPRQTNELAKMMNADVIRAEPVGEGPISNIVIPPGTIDDARTTIISVPQAAAAAADESKAASSIANRSIQVISETLDEQEAAEVAAVQNKLEDLQQARRDFVMAVANVGGNAVNIADEGPPETIHRVPDVETEAFQVEHGRDHPDVVAAREFLRKAKESMAARIADRRLEEEFERIAEEVSDDLHLGVPYEEEFYVDKDISWEEDEELGTAMPVQSRVKAYASPIPQQQQAYKHKSFDPEELERFFDLENYPPCPVCQLPPDKGSLHPDLWELDDPWYQPMPQPPMGDLMEFDLIDF
ncbi:uncharacterized protein LOC143219069 [Lasioglossum baleicum]|uniref:uncharacterized protein LOC143219069 n=1 Tax=Lasioglossum baleicum TaxID=434251 RepID=UPI003FCC6683